LILNVLIINAIYHQRLVPKRNSPQMIPAHGGTFLGKYARTAGWRADEETVH